MRLLHVGVGKRGQAITCLGFSQSQVYGQGNAVALLGDIVARALCEALHLADIGLFLGIRQLKPDAHFPVELIQLLKGGLYFALKGFQLILSVYCGVHLDCPFGSGKPVGHIFDFFRRELDVPKGFIDFCLDCILVELPQGRAYSRQARHYAADNHALRPKGSQDFPQRPHRVGGFTARLHQFTDVTYGPADALGKFPNPGGGRAHNL